MPAFVILAHKNPQQVARLAHRIAPHPVLLHIDAAASSQQFATFQQAMAGLGHVRFTPRHRSGWGAWGIVEAMLEGLRSALSAGDWSHVMIISGQDYPVVSAADMKAFLDEHAGISFLPSFALPSPYWGGDGGLDRIRYWQRPIFRKRFVLPVPRRFPDGLIPAGGSMFNCLTRDMAERVLEFGRIRPDVPRFYRHTWIPEEMYFPTVVMNLADPDTVAGESLTYIRWSDAHSAHPDFLTEADATELIEAGRGVSSAGGWARRKLFARKIDMAAEPGLLDALDRAVHAIEPATPALR